METSFCSRCGFLLTGTAEIIRTGGALPDGARPRGFSAPTPRNRGMKQGLFIFLLAFLVVPLVTIFSIGLGIGPVPSIVATILLSVGGLLRVAYAYLFESPLAIGESYADQAAIHGTHNDRAGLPPQREYDAASFVSPQGRWRDTNDLEPKSVTESTTRLLEYEEKP